MNNNENKDAIATTVTKDAIDATVKDAEASVRKIKASGRSHAHKTQAAIAMEQRAKAAGKTAAAGVYRRFIESQKKKTRASRRS